MIQCAPHNDMFNPSTSWILKSGVNLEYTPEDTLKSMIFQNVETDQPHDSSQVNNKKSLSVNFCNEVEEIINNKEHKTENYNQSNLKRISKGNCSSLRTPAPFLRRRQGVSAWCSKIRKQGVPVVDVTRNLPKRPNKLKNSTVCSSLRVHSYQMNEPICSDELQSNNEVYQLTTAEQSNSHSSNYKKPAVLSDSNDLNCQIKSKIPLFSTVQPTVNESGDLTEFEMLEEFTNNLSLTCLKSVSDGKVTIEDSDFFIYANSKLNENKVHSDCQRSKIGTNTNKLTTSCCNPIDSLSTQSHVSSIPDVVNGTKSRKIARCNSSSIGDQLPSNHLKSSNQNGHIVDKSEETNDSLHFVHDSKYAVFDFNDADSWSGDDSNDANEFVQHFHTNHQDTDEQNTGTDRTQTELPNEIEDVNKLKSSHILPVDQSHGVTYEPPSNESKQDTDSDNLPSLNNVNEPALRDWIKRLESEVKRFKTENAHLISKRNEFEQSSKRLQLETKRFEENKTKLTKEFEEYKESEMRRLKKEKRVLEDYQRAMKTMPSKKDREEIERLKEELHECRLDLGHREAQWQATVSRLRARVDELEHERAELKNCVKKLEDERLHLQSQTTKLLNDHHQRSDQSVSHSTRQTLHAVTQSICLDPHDNKDVDRQLHNSSGLVNQRPSKATSHNLPSFGQQKHTISLPRARHHHHHHPQQPSKYKPTEYSHCESPDHRQSCGYGTGDEDHASVSSSGERHGGSVSSRESRDKTTMHFGKSLVHNPNTALFTAPLSFNNLDNLPVPNTAASGSVVRTVQHTDGSIEKTYSNGAVVVSYSNGSVKEIFPDGLTILVSLFNGDIKRTLPDGIVIYHYATDETIQITYADGSEELIFKDGRREIIHSKCLLVSHGNNSCSSSDQPESVKTSESAHSRQTMGKHVHFDSHLDKTLSNLDREIILPNGQREIHTSSGVKCRVYPDGTTKTVFPDGRQETRYASGRLRIKDGGGNLVLDTRLPPNSHHSGASPLTPLNI